ncbi:MAG: translation elongation factor 4 [Candidatus Pacebacteria bacterium]|nr:translation elongation factor 4 [Candidatus Paceibacterota bacterium]MDD4201210.1 translation elongation factor 4 [Candidatus Paceibacterota bacterium]MDD4466866.1 translation elongation factor 4 [Candidatus Paceibacterota bacterium]MDD4897453.1 translation elongation factor 4 [Candidatus Paceibacterota bacterium]
MIKNFVIISHIDHGKSTLADRFLEITGTVSSKEMKPQLLDSMDIERERGITIKMQPVRMDYVFNSTPYILNLIDTPGHVDFSYEVSRALAAVEGAVLLVDASKGIQAQTIANLDLAKKQGLVIIPVVNKIDLSFARVEETVKELADLLSIKRDQVIKISAKSGLNVDLVLKAIIEKVPSPKEEKEEDFQALIFDSDYDSYKGVIAYVRVNSGSISSKESIEFAAEGFKTEVKEVGYFLPKATVKKEIKSGEVGYIATGVKEPGKVKVGDTIIKSKSTAKPLPGYKEPQPVVFASFYPEKADDFNLLKDALGKLRLSDPALIFEPESREALGRGFRCGFLGTLHIEIVSERLKREFGLNLVISTPSVVYKIKNKRKEEELIYSASDWPDQSEILETFEPWVSLEIVLPSEYYGALMDVLQNIQGNYVDTKYLGQERMILFYEAPLSEIIVGFYDKVKSSTKGYASVSYNLIGFREGDLVKMEVFIAGNKEEAFSKIVSKEKIFSEGKSLVLKLKQFLPSQQFAVALQVYLHGKVIARETISARRKDVTGDLYGGDYSRKRKLLEKQKKGKKALKEKGRVKIPSKVFLDVYRG